jgi:uncharacterized membrane protein YfcA
VLYSSVGHAGASGYLAAMALFDVQPSAMRPTALLLNLLVASIGTIKFHRAGHFSWPLFWPFAVGSVPFAFVGGTITLPTTVYRPLLGGVLLYSAARLGLEDRSYADTPEAIRPVPRTAAFALGALIGLLAGLTGVGGGIFLSPLLLLMRWAPTRRTAAVSVAFILANSVAGLAGQMFSMPALPRLVPVWAGVAAVGGWIGAHWGSRKLPSAVLRRLLAVVLVVAGGKLILAR